MRKPTIFGQRTKHFPTVQETPRKYILVYEGNQTEVQYFNGIIANREELNISPILELVPLLRSVPDDTASHPKKILKLLEEYLECYWTVKVIIDKIIDYITEKVWEEKSSGTVIKIMRKDFQDFITEDLHKCLNDEVKDLPEFIDQMKDCIEKWCSPLVRIEDLICYIKEQEQVYEEGYDKICIVIDRNKRNLESYKEYLRQCDSKGYSLYVTTPDIEFWLLLHSDKVFDYEYDDLLKNDKKDLAGEKSKKRYLEHVLSEVFGGYQKGNIRFPRFLPYVNKAIINEKEFCEDIEELDHKLGSNVGLLLKELKEQG